MSASAVLNPYQRVLVASYAAGEYAHITTEAEAEEAGDTLFLFLFRELATSDCDSVDTALSYLDAAMADISVVRDAMHAAYQAGLK